MSPILSEFKCTNMFLFLLLSFFHVQQYKYRDLTVREITNVISQYKDLKPVMDAYGKRQALVFVCVMFCLLTNIDLQFFCVSVFNDGSSRDLMSLTGTVPVSYRGNKICFSY